MESETLARLREIVAGEESREGAALPLLHAVQAAFGCIPDAAIAPLADHLNISRAELRGIVSFYHDFRREPAGRVVIRLCRAEACQASGGVALAGRVRAALGIDFGQTTADGAVTLEPVFCLGLCAAAPAGMIDGVPHARLDASRVDALLEQAR